MGRFSVSRAGYDSLFKVSNTQSLHCINSYLYVYVSLLVENILKSAGDLVHVKIVFCCCILSD